MWGGEEHHHHHHHHHREEYPPPEDPYGGPAAIPQPYGQLREYNAGYDSGYAPDNFAGGFAPPPGPPPGAEHHHHYNREDEYAPPPGPPPRAAYDDYGAPDGYAPPPGPPSGAYGGYAPPDGPPPPPPSGRQHFGPAFEDQSGDTRQLHFQYSQCTGRRKALCIGINYIGSSQQLNGCINDAHNVRRFLIEDFGYQEGDIVMLTDDQSNPRSIPTKQNMLEAMRWLVHNAQPHDALFLHYSGHGGQTKNMSGDSAGGYDDVIYPVDFREVGHIIDEELWHTLVKPLPAGCRLTSIFDSCHSGTVMDLPYGYNHLGQVREPDLGREAMQGLLAGFPRGISGIVEQLVDGYGRVQRQQQLTQTRASPADIVEWSGCRDDQTSADTVEGGQATGAMSYAFIHCLRENRQQSYIQLLTNIRAKIGQRYSQTPQLSSSHPIDTSLMFIC